MGNNIKLVSRCRLLDRSASSRYQLMYRFHYRIQIHSFGTHTISYLRVTMLGDNSLAHALIQLAERNLNLVSTMVQDIPMKEEANSGSVSTMYGVELLHEAEGHAFLRDRGLASRLYLREENNEMKFRSPPSGFSKTLGISWMAPRPTDNTTTKEFEYLRYSIGAFRVTMAAVANRSSVCLSQFILSGKCVLLGQKEESKDVLSEVFLLLCHGNLMYLHVLATSVPLASPPNLPLFPEKSKADVGKDTGFRISQFINDFIIPSRLAPASASATYSEIPKVRAHQVVERATRYWPLRNESSLLCGNKTAAPLFEHLPKDIIEVAEITACEAAIDNIIKTIVSLPVPIDSTSNSLLCNTPVATVVELSFLLELYADISVDHGALLENFKKKMDATMYASHRLSKLIQKATELLFHGNPTPGSSLSNLTEVKRIAASQSKVAPKVLPIPELISRKQSRNITYTPVPGDVFIRQLLQAGRKPIKPDREFEGVLAAGGSKRIIPLYGGLKHDDPQK
nr:cell cycle regulator mat89bb [Hymenolepis microstoma]